MDQDLSNFRWSDGSYVEIVRRPDFLPDDFSKSLLTVNDEVFSGRVTEGLQGNISLTELAALAMQTVNLPEHKVILDNLPDNFVGRIALVGPDSEGKLYFIMPPESIDGEA